MTVRDYSEQDIHLALDGEMPDEDAAGYRAWLEGNPEMSARAERYAADRGRMREALAGVIDEPVPARLTGAVSEGSPVAGHAWFRRAAAAAILLAAGGIGGYLLGDAGLQDTSPERSIAQDAIAAHAVYAAEKLHVVEVGADQKDHLVGWLSKRVGLSLVAPDLTAQGFELVGGRLLPSGETTAAQFMYQDRSGNRVSLYVTSEAGAPDTGFRLVEAERAKAYYWLDDGYGCAVAGTVPEERLMAVTNAAYRQLLGSEGI